MPDNPKNGEFRGCVGGELTEADYAHLSRSFITREVAIAARLSRVHDEEGAQVVGRKRNANTSFCGIIFPMFRPPDYERPREFRLRRDVPDLERDSKGLIKETAKYLSPPGVANFLYFPPGMSMETLNSPKVPIVIVEGEKKVLALYRVALALRSGDQLPLVPIGITGVWNFRGVVGKAHSANGSRANVKGPINDLDLIVFKGRKVTILFDSNVRSNPNVFAARFALSRVLKKRAANVHYAELPADCAVNGVDDYLGKIESSEGTEAAIAAASALLENAEKPKKTFNPTPANFSLDSDGEHNDVPGVYYTDGTGEHFLVCSPLKVVALTFTQDGRCYGRWLTWLDSEEREKSWAMPIEMVHGDAQDLVRHLSSMGLRIGTSRKHYDCLRAYINLSDPQDKYICTDRVGWHGDSYVLPDECIGGNQSIKVQTKTRSPHKFRERGTLEEWQSNISKYCIGNSRLSFAVSAAFSSTLLPFLGVHCGGFHFFGVTSIGKTTVLRVAGSVFGGSDQPLGYCETWRQTDNSLEGTCLAHNHGLLCLDEIGQCDPKKVGEIAYMIANGHGKGRMTKEIASQPGATWQLMFLSSGEARLVDIADEAGRSVKGGQSIRFCDLEADTGAFGIFETLHEFATGQALADHIREASKQFYGAPIRAFLRSLAERGRGLEQWPIFRSKFMERLHGGGAASPEVARVSGLFAAVAWGGEIATQLGVTGWTEGEASRAALSIFQTWQRGRDGVASVDEENVVRIFRSFLEAHGQSRFQSVDSEESPSNERPIINRAGFRKTNTTGDETYFYFLPEMFKEVCKGVVPAFARKTLKNRGYLITDAGKWCKTVRLPQIGAKKIYAISSRIFESGHLEDAAEQAFREFLTDP